MQQTRLWINNNYSLIKHWLFVIIGITLVAFAVLSYANSNRLLKQVNVLAEQNKVLSQQNKKLNQETSATGDATQKVVLQNRTYIQCLSDIFAKYTQDFVPVTIQNLGTCAIKTGTSGTLAPGNAGSAPNQSASSTSPAASATVPAPSQTSSSSSSSPQSAPSPPTKQANFLQRILNDINPLN